MFVILKNHDQPTTSKVQDKTYSEDQRHLEDSRYESTTRSKLWFKLWLYDFISNSSFDRMKHHKYNDFEIKWKYQLQPKFRLVIDSYLEHSRWHYFSENVLSYTLGHFLETFLPCGYTKNIVESILVSPVSLQRGTFVRNVNISSKFRHFPDPLGFVHVVQQGLCNTLFLYQWSQWFKHALTQCQLGKVGGKKENPLTLHMNSTSSLSISRRTIIFIFDKKCSARSFIASLYNENIRKYWRGISSIHVALPSGHWVCPVFTLLFRINFRSFLNLTSDLLGGQQFKTAEYH